MNIELQTRDGQLVAIATTLPFQIMPEIMLWGERFFIFTGTYTGKDLPIYIEGICCIANVVVE
jgi:hypothetical protein